MYLKCCKERARSAKSVKASINEAESNEGNDGREDLLEEGKKQQHGRGAAWLLSLRVALSIFGDALPVSYLKPPLEP